MTRKPSIFEKFNEEVKKEKQNIPDLAQIFTVKSSTKLVYKSCIFYLVLPMQMESFHNQNLDKVEQIAAALGIRSNDMESIKAMFIKATGNAYKILEIESTASNEEVKKAYRTMAKEIPPR